MWACGEYGPLVQAAAVLNKEQVSPSMPVGALAKLPERVLLRLCVTGCRTILVYGNKHSALTFKGGCIRWRGRTFWILVAAFIVTDLYFKILHELIATAYLHPFFQTFVPNSAAFRPFSFEAFFGGIHPTRNLVLVVLVGGSVQGSLLITFCNNVCFRQAYSYSHCEGRQV